MNVSIKESVSSICANDLSVSLTDTEPDCMPFRVDSNICIISRLLESINSLYGFAIKFNYNFF